MGILDEPEIHAGDDVLVPDLAGWRRTKMPRVPDTAYFTLAPDWVCEVLSPGTAMLDRKRKLAIYAREGAAHAWLLDALERTLEVLRLDHGQWVIVPFAQAATRFVPSRSTRCRFRSGICGQTDQFSVNAAWPGMRAQPTED